MKSAHKTIVKTIMLFICLNVIGQIKTNKLLQHDKNNEIKIISIIDINNPVEIKNLDLLAEKYKRYNIEFIAITDEINDSISYSLKNQLLHYKFVKKTENERIFNSYQTGMFKVFPMQVILNKSGEITYIKKGTTKSIDKKLAKRIDKLLILRSTKYILHEDVVLLADRNLH